MGVAEKVVHDLEKPGAIRVGGRDSVPDAVSEGEGFLHREIAMEVERFFRQRGDFDAPGLGESLPASMLATSSRS